MGTIRKACDDNPEENGSYYLTGSTSVKVYTPHTETGRITEIIMYPMTLWETGDSDGSISLIELFNNNALDTNGFKNKLSLEDYFFIICRGKWPRTLAIKDSDAKLEIAKDCFEQIYKKDINSLDGTTRNPEWARRLLWSYARNMATLAIKKNIYSDVKANFKVSITHFPLILKFLKNYSS